MADLRYVNCVSVDFVCMLISYVCCEVLLFVFSSTLSSVFFWFHIAFFHSSLFMVYLFDGSVIPCAYITSCLFCGSSRASTCSPKKIIWISEKHFQLLSKHKFFYLIKNYNPVDFLGKRQSIKKYVYLYQLLWKQ